MNKLVKPLIVLIVLVALALVIHFTGRDRSRPDARLALKVNVDMSSVGRIEISVGQDSVELVKVSEGWTVKTADGSKAADERAIQGVLTELGNINNADLVSHNPEKQDEFRVDEGNGTRLRIYKPDSTLLDDLIIGKIGGFESASTAVSGGFNPQAFYTYMRRSGSDRVYKVPGFFGGVMSADVESWRDRRIFEFQPSEVHRLTLEYPDQSIVLEADTSGTWKMTEPRSAPLDSAVAERLFQSLGTLRADSFQDSSLADSETGLDKPTCRLNVVLQSGYMESLDLGKEFKENFFYARKAGQDQLYEVAKYRVDQILKKPDELLSGEKK